MVVTVPANFNNRQKQATKDACEVAGIECIRIITEPVAAALAYKLQETVSEDGECVIVFDFGGGTLDLSVLFISPETVSEETTRGDPSIGGQDIDNKIIDWMVQQINLRTNHDYSWNKPAQAMLRKEAVIAK